MHARPETSAKSNCLDAALAQVDLFFGEASDALARIYARLDGSHAASDAVLKARVEGPRCAYARTLTATVGFRATAPGESLLLEAVIPDPCFWTFDLPFLYDVHLEMSSRGESVAAMRTLGIRRLAAAGNRFAFDARPWVLRAAAHPELSDSADGLSDYRETHLSVLIDECSDQLAESASEIGVPLLANVHFGDDENRDAELNNTDALLDEVARLARWPAVAAVIFRQGPSADVLAAARRRAPNLLFGFQLTAASTSDPQVESADADFHIVAADDPLEDLAERLASPTPLVVVDKPSSASHDAAADRARCDTLQRRLAPVGQFAGYIA